MGESNWIYYDVTAAWEDKAKEIRAIRDGLYDNIYEEEETDLRWVGDLGEICFNDWIKRKGMKGFQWHRDNAAGKPDFTINNIRIDIKTVKRKVPPIPSYTAQITAQHRTHPIDELFFMSYEYLIKRLWFLGGIKLSDFIAQAKYYKGGEFVHSNYQVRPGHEIFNAEISILTPPYNWLGNTLL